MPHLLNEILLRLQAFYFEAALVTYAGNSPKSTIPDLPGSHVYSYPRGRFLYVDQYYTCDDRSSGITFIYVDDQPVWTMSYEGQGSPTANIFLKIALTHAYQQGLFRGGRGPEEFWQTKPNQTKEDAGTLLYRNDLHAGHGRFDHFSGRDSIIRMPSREEIYWHEYRGLIMAHEQTLLRLLGDRARP
jgi:hypothetical protein